MAPKTVICRICVQETDKNDVQDLDWKKLGSFIANNYLQDPFDAYEGHVICCSCIDNFNTISNLHRLVSKSNIILTRLKTTLLEESATSTEINLKDIFNDHVGEDIAVCRLCLDTTKQIAIRLFESSINIVPPDYLKSMFFDMNINLTLLDQTKKPIICFQCWQRIQVCYSFHKQLDVAVSKLKYYQRISQNMYLDQQDLDDILYMWDKLDLPDTSLLEISSDQHISDGPMNISSSSLVDHDYCNNISVENLEPDNIQVLDASANSDVISDMPVLCPNSQDNHDTLKVDACKNPLQNKIVIKENRRVNLKRSSHKKSRHRMRESLSNGTANKREKSMRILKSTLLAKTVSNNIPILQASDNSEGNKRYNLRSSSGFNFKEEDVDFEDLLVLKKQVVIKNNPSQAQNLPFEQNDNSPPILEDQCNIQARCHTYNDYTIENLSFDNHPHVENRNRILEQEIQVKAEVLSDSDDDFVEETPGIFSDTDLFIDNDDGMCPSLVGFVKTEPEELIDVTATEDEPPELDFHGPCNNISNLNMLNSSIGVNEKRRIIELFDEDELNVPESISNEVLGPLPITDTSKNQQSTMEAFSGSLFERNNCDLDSMPQLESHLSLDSSLKSCKSSKKKAKSRSKSKLSSVLQPEVDYKMGNGDANDIKPKSKGLKFKASLSDVPYTCTKCEYRSITKRSMVFHAEMHNSQKAKLLTCEFCSFIAINKDTFRRHRKNHLDNPGHDLCFECNLHSPTIYCMKCSKDFHPYCLIAHQRKNKDCIHFGLEGVLNICKKEVAMITLGGTSNTIVSCVYCKRIASKSFIDCQICERQFHYECFYARDKKCRIVCMHLVRILRRMYIKGEGLKMRCKLCEHVLEYVTPCLSCHSVMHYSCYRKHAALETSDCDHAHVLYGLPLDMQSSPPQLQPSTSFNTKHSTLSFNGQF